MVMKTIWEFIKDFGLTIILLIALFVVSYLCMTL